MKKFVRSQKTLFSVSLIVALLLGAITGDSQVLPELVFKNPTLVSGTALADGAKYKFSNVSAGVDAVVQIMGRTSAAVVITSMDTVGTGYDRAWQPVIKYNGTAAANTSWSVDFRISFYKAGTNTATQISFNATAIDMDGDNSTVREWATFKKIKPGSLQFAAVTSVTKTLLGSQSGSGNPDNNGDDYKLTGTVIQYPGIDTTQTLDMARFSYDTKDQIDITIGGSTGASSATNPERLSSIWFKSIYLGPGLFTLPVKLVDFTAKYNKTDVTLNWQSAEETDFNYYELEHSTDGSEFSTTAIIFGAAPKGGGAEYTYADKSVAGRGGLIYYRLKMVDVDGNFTYSPVRIVRLGEEANTLTLMAYPNPVTTDLRITLPESWQNKQVTFRLYNVNGQCMTTLNIANSSQTESIPVASLQKGAYFVKVNCGNDIASKQIIKN